MTTDPKFKNRDNKVYKTEDGEVWASRSCAIVGAILFIFKEELYVLAEKRSKLMDSPGLWCIPCGYMDWNENGEQALIREIYEETKLYLPDYKDYGILNMEQPFFVQTDPSENRQNISLSYTNVYRFELEDEEAFKSAVHTAEKYGNSEVERVKFIKIININRYKWAFNHDNRIRSAIDFVQEQLIEVAADIIASNLVITPLNTKKTDWWKKILNFWRT